MRLCTKKDHAWLTALMLDADVFGGCSEDGTVKSKMPTYVKSLLARPNITVIAPVPGKMIHTFVRQNGVLAEIHTAIKKSCELSGKERVEHTRAACIWMIKNRGVRKFITHVPAGNRAAGLYAVACGLERVGVLTSAFKKGGELLDLTLYQSKDSEIQKVLEGI